MGRIINSTFITADGVVANPQNWVEQDADDTAGVLQYELLSACDAVLLGRRTYEVFAAAWPTVTGDRYADRLNSMPKYVVSSTLHSPEWTNTNVLRDDPVAEIERLKADSGKDLVQYGFGQLSHTLMDHGLLDEVRLWVNPVFYRRGGPQDLLYREGPVSRLDLVDTQVLKSGAVILSYEVRSR